MATDGTTDDGGDTGPDERRSNPVWREGYEQGYQAAIHEMAARADAAAAQAAGEQVQAQRRRYRGRHIRQTVTFVLLVGLVVAVGWGGWKVYQGEWNPFSSPAAAAPCPSYAPTAAPVKNIQLNVYNATVKPGVAQAVARELVRRGLTVISIGNDPQKGNITSAAVVRSGPAGLYQARTVGGMVDGDVQILLDPTRQNATVDLVIGNAWKRLLPLKDALAKGPTIPLPSPSGCLAPSSTSGPPTSGSASPTARATTTPASKPTTKKP